MIKICLNEIILLLFNPKKYVFQVVIFQSHALGTLFKVGTTRIINLYTNSIWLTTATFLKPQKNCNCFNKIELPTQKPVEVSIKLCVGAYTSQFCSINIAVELSKSEYTKLDKTIAGEKIIKTRFSLAIITFSDNKMVTKQPAQIRLTLFYYVCTNEQCTDKD